MKSNFFAMETIAFHKQVICWNCNEPALLMISCLDHKHVFSYIWRHMYFICVANFLSKHKPLQMAVHILAVNIWYLNFSKA